MEAELRNKLIDVAKQYSREILNPFDEALKVNVYISGSVSYGFCDKMSDIEMEFYFPEETDKELVLRVEHAIDSLPEFMGVHMSAGVSEWGLEKIVNGDIKAYWDKFNPYTLYELTTALPIREDFPLIAKVKERIAFYPSDICSSVVKGLWLTVIDSGAYNADYSFKRDEKFISSIFFFRAMEALLRLTYIANKKYYPHTKWLARGLTSLETDFGLKELVADFEGMPIDEKIKKLNTIAGKVSESLVSNNMLEPKYKDNAWDIMADKYFIFSTF